jgi:arylsulfatase A-like enzyme
MTPRRPNILLLLADQQRADTIAALGNPIIRTPALDRLVHEGTSFRSRGFERVLTYWNRAQNRYKYWDGGYDRLLSKTIRAAYYACISFLDFQIGRILESLGGQAGNTLIVFSSDHGELLGDYGSFGKRCMLDAAARVPLLVRWPKAFRAGARCATPATLLDLWPTFLSAAGEPQPRACADGVDLLATNRKR